MENLKCTTSNCEFHFKNHCTAGNVELSEKGVCLTKRKRPGGAYAQSIAEFELAEELAPLLEKEIDLQCECTECALNVGKVCSSNEVLIGDSILSTKCFSKRKR